MPSNSLEPEPQMDDPGHLPVLRASAERTAVLLMAHGSREASANDDLHALADRLAASGEHPIVVTCSWSWPTQISRPGATAA